jgi:hypothetical protein
LGLNRTAFVSCLALPPARVSSDQESAAALGISSTPTFLVGRPLPGGRMTAVRRVSGGGRSNGLDRAIEDVRRHRRLATLRAESSARAPAQTRPAARTPAVREHFASRQLRLRRHALRGLGAIRRLFAVVGSLGHGRRPGPSEHYLTSLASRSMAFVFRGFSRNTNCSSSIASFACPVLAHVTPRLKCADSRAGSR